MRIVGGKLAGRSLTSPADSRVRPTAEPVRAALLDALGADVQGARVLDLFAGSGALGLEAISRGARYADFVEFRPASLHALRANVAALRLREKTRIYKRDAIPFITNLEAGKYDIAFADPPYTSKLVERVVESWKDRGFSRILAVEHARGVQLAGSSWTRVFEDTVVAIFIR
jgi:16S rRNA (guanine966-N2)-methyltransferase